MNVIGREIVGILPSFLRDARIALKTWLSSLSAVGWLVLSAIIEAVFFFTYGFVAGPIKQKIIENIIVVGAMISERSASATTTAVQTGQSIITLLASTPGVSQYLWQLLWLQLLLLAAGFSIFCVFHATLWFIAHQQSTNERTAHMRAHQELLSQSHQAQSHQAQSHQAQSHQVQSHQVQSHQVQSHQVQSHQVQSHQVQSQYAAHDPGMSWSVFVARFALLSVWWGLLVIVYEVADLLFTLRSAVAGEGTSGGIGPLILSAIVALLLLVAAWSYAMPLCASGRRGFMAAFRAVVRHWRITAPVTLFIAVVFIALNYVIVLMSRAGEWLWLIAGGILFVIVLAWARLYLVLSVQRMGLEGEQERVHLKEAHRVGP